MNKDIKKIAIVRLSALGDIVNSAVVLQFIKEKYKNVLIDWVTEEVFAPVLEGHPLINSVHTVNIKALKRSKSFADLKALIVKLRNIGEYDIVIDMQGLLKSAIVSRLIGSNNFGFDKNSTREGVAALFYKRSAAIAYEENIVKRNCHIVAEALQFKIDAAMILNKKAIFPVRESFSFAEGRKNIAFVIGASWESKIYPKELVLKVVNALDVDVFIVWGSSEERARAEWIVEKSTNATLAPRLSLSALISYISHMDLLIGNDTGPTHMAWAQNIASITLFGPTNSRMIYETEKNIALESPSDVDILKINKEDFSIKEIDYTEIVREAKELLGC